VRHRHIAK